MGSTGLFLGAGASYELGMPLVWELTRELRDWLTPEKLRGLVAGWRRQGNAPSDALIDDFVTILERDDLHYEAMLGYLETQQRRQPTLAQDYSGFYAWLVEIVYYLLYHRQVHNDDYLALHLPFFDGIAYLARQNTPLWVFSLNHDVMIETIAAGLGLPVHTGFGPEEVVLPRRDAQGRKIGELRGAVLRQDVVEHGALPFPTPASGIHLLKIHGALDIFTFNDGKDLLKLGADAETPTEIFQRLRQANEELRYIDPRFPGAPFKATNEIAYADDDGEMQFLRRSILSGAYKFEPGHSQVLPVQMLAHFRQNLNFVSRLACIGYGFGDQHINTALRSWLEASDSRHLEIVNPGIRETPGVLLHVAGQVTLNPSGAADWLDAQAGIVRSPVETLNKRLAVVMRKLGKARAQAAQQSFIAEFIDRRDDEVIQFLESLPKVDGKPDLDSIGGLESAKARIASLTAFDQEGFLRQLIAHAENFVNAPVMPPQTQ